MIHQEIECLAKFTETVYESKTSNDLENRFFTETTPLKKQFGLQKHQAFYKSFFRDKKICYLKISSWIKLAFEKANKYDWTITRPKTSPQGKIEFR